MYETKKLCSPTYFDFYPKYFPQRSFTRNITDCSRAFTKNNISRISTIYHFIAGTKGKKVTIGTMFLASSVGAFSLSSNLSFIYEDIASKKILSGSVGVYAFFTTLYFSYHMCQSLLCAILSYFQTEEKPIEPLTEFPFVTVQIPTRNEPFEIVRDLSIASALKLNYPVGQLQIQVVDNSDRGRYSELENYCIEKGIQFIHRDGKEGAKARNLNIGLDKAAGDFILLVDCDSTFAPDDLLKIMPRFKDPKLGYVQCFLYTNNKSDNLYTKIRATIRDAYGKYLQPQRLSFSFKGCYGHNLVIRKKALEEIGGWGETLVAEDYEASIKIMERGYRGGFTATPTMGDGLPNTFRAANVQQRKWTYGSSQIAMKKLQDYLKIDFLTWDEKLDILLTLPGYFSSITLAWVSFGLITPITLAVNHLFPGQNNNCTSYLSSFTNLFYLWLATNVVIAGRVARDDPKEALRYLKYFIPQQILHQGHTVESTKAIYSLITGKDEGWRITPKGIEDKDSLIKVIKSYPWEFSLGLSFLTLGVALGGSLWLLLMGIGMVASPLTQWDRKKVL